MRMFGRKRNRNSSLTLCGGWKILVILLAILAPSLRRAYAQAADPPTLAQQIQQLTDAMTKVQAQLEQSQHQLEELRKELTELRSQMPQGTATAPAHPDSVPESSSASAEEAARLKDAELQELKEHQEVLDAEIATQEQTKVESESKYPVKITGMVLLNSFVNTGAVDVASNPSLAIGGSGSAGASMRQTMFGIDARGPHLFGAYSAADLRMDFYGSPAASESPSTYSGLYNTNTGLLRLRTAHAGLYWDRTQVYFALDRPIISADAPTSLTAASVPALAWSGNLWTWNPQVGITQKFGPIQLQAAMIDAGDAPLTPTVAPSGSSTTTPPTSPTPPTSAEQSSRPGIEARVALLGSEHEEDRNHFGAGGYFATHTSVLGNKYDSWAATLDARLLLFVHLQFSGSAYRGLALGGLGGGGYKDFAYSPNPNTGYYFRTLDDAGGWAQLKEKLNDRLEFNEAYGMDNVFANDLRRYFVYDASMAQNLARNRTFTGNVIYSPSAYLLFSLEYRHLESAPVAGAPDASNIIGLGAGYKF